MAIMQIGTPTGYSAIDSSDDLQNQVPDISRVEMNGNYIVLYLNEVSAKVPATRYKVGFNDGRPVC